jgi:tellurite resistance protein
VSNSKKGEDRAVDIPLRLDEELAQLFLGALLTVARADGIVNPLEVEMIQQIAGELGVQFDVEALLSASVHRRAFAAAARRATGTTDPYRGPTNSDAAQIAEAWIAAAQRVAGADGVVSDEEASTIASFAKELTPANELRK